MKRIIQFGFRRHGNPLDGLTPIVNCTVIPNPWRRGDRATDEQRMEKVRKHPRFHQLVGEAVVLFSRFDEIGIACQFGRHRSGAVALAVKAELERIGHEVEIVKYGEGT